VSFLTSRLRATARLFAFAWIVLSSAVWLVRCPRDLAARARWLQWTCQRSLRVLGVKIHAVGEPAAGAIIVANHVSYLDILVLAAQHPVVFVAKREVRSWPIFGWFAQQACTRFIDRERRGDVARVAAEFAPAVASGVSVVIFLEGTSTDGKIVRPFKSSLLAPAVEQQWQIVPAAISYSLPAGHDVATEVCWWGEMTLTPHLLHLFTLSRIQAFVAWGAAETASNDRKALALEMHARVTRLHVALATTSAQKTPL
jgi:lyso-ornithine lipid O-acyltransferase